MSSSPVRDISFGTALKITLNNFYDALKVQIGTLESNEKVQLRLTAVPIDASTEYPWNSFYKLLIHADTTLDPTPISDNIQTTVNPLYREYEHFLRQLRKYVSIKELGDRDKERLEEIELEINNVNDKYYELIEKEYNNWYRYCDIRGIDYGDRNTYLQWRARWGQGNKIELLYEKKLNLIFERRKLLDKQFSDPEFQRIVAASQAFDNVANRLRLPFFEDNNYDDVEKFNVEYFAGLPEGSTALFDDRRIIRTNESIEKITTVDINGFDFSFDSSYEESETIETDWKTSGNASYNFIKVKASTSDHSTISTDFSKTNKISIKSESTFQSRLIFGPWFDPGLFSLNLVKENFDDFGRFLGSKGTLRYYPTALILIRGFDVSFESTQNWVFDYERKFKASSGGGFSVGGISFGAKGSYGKNIEEHKVKQSNTKLTIKDGESTVRLLGYVVKENMIGGDELLSGLAKSSLQSFQP